MPARVYTMVCYVEVLFKSSSPCVGQHVGLRNMRLPTRWLGSGLRNGAHRASQNVTVHRLSACSKTCCSQSHLHNSRLFQAEGAKTCCAHHPCIDRPILCCLLSQYTHKPIMVHFGVHTSQVMSLHLDPRQYIITTTVVLRARMVGLDDERHEDKYSGQPEVAHRLRC